MNTKKFPTPNLDAWSNCVKGSFDILDDAVQADIALAVKEAVKVPKLAVEVLGPLLEKAIENRKREYLAAKSTHKPTPEERASLASDMAELLAIKAWLESLTVAPEPAPVLVPMQFVETRTKTGENTFAVDSIEPVEPAEKRCGTCAAFREVAEDARECLRRQRDMPWTNENYHCWKAKQ